MYMQSWYNFGIIDNHFQSGGNYEKTIITINNYVISVSCVWEPR